MNKQQIREWMMARLDGESTPQQDAEIDLWTGADPELRREYEQMQAVKKLAQQHQPGRIPPEKWDQYWLNVYPRLERSLAWLLISLGALILLAAAGWELAQSWLMDPELPWWLKVAGVSLWLGGALLLISVVREKLFLHKHERYKDIQR